MDRQGRKNSGDFEAEGELRYGNWKQKQKAGRMDAYIRNEGIEIGDPRLLWRESDGCQYAISADGCKGSEKADEIYSKGI